MDFNCTVCNKNLKTKQALQYHLRKKIPCNQIRSCERCGYIANTKQHLDRHMNKKNKCKIQDSVAQIRELESKLKISELEKKILQLEQCKSITNINTINNINNIIVLNNFGNESAIFFTKKNITELLIKEVDNFYTMWNDPIMKANKYLLKDNKNQYKYTYAKIPILNIALFFLQNLYQNKDFPQDHTIKYNIDDDTFQIYKNEEWVEVCELDTLNLIFDKIRNIIKREKVLDKKFYKIITPNGKQSSHDDIRIYVGEFDKVSERYTTPIDQLKIQNINEKYEFKLILSSLKNILNNQTIDHDNNLTT